MPARPPGSRDREHGLAERSLHNAGIRGEDLPGKGAARGGGIGGRRGLPESFRPLLP
jgi:hypothetical protein